MSNVIEREVKTEVEDGTGNIFEVQFTRKTYWEHDSDYGADADGRRGEAIDFVEEDRADAVMVKVAEVYVKLEEVNDEIRTRIEEAIDAYLRDNEPDAPESDYDGDGGGEPEDMPGADR